MVRLDSFKRKILVLNELIEDLKNNRDSPKEQKLSQIILKKQILIILVK